MFIGELVTLLNTNLTLRIESRVFAPSFILKAYSLYYPYFLEFLFKIIHQLTATVYVVVSGLHKHRMPCVLYIILETSNQRGTFLQFSCIAVKLSTSGQNQWPSS